MKPVITHKGGQHRFSLPDIETTIIVDRLRTGINGLKGVITIEHLGSAIQRSGIELLSISSRDSLRRKLEKRHATPGGEYTWGDLIDKACIAVDEAWASADPVTDLGDILPGEGMGVKWLSASVHRRG